MGCPQMVRISLLEICMGKYLVGIAITILIAVKLNIILSFIRYDTMDTGNQAQGDVNTVDTEHPFGVGACV